MNMLGGQRRLYNIAIKWFGTINKLFIPDTFFGSRLEEVNSVIISRNSDTDLIKRVDAIQIFEVFDWTDFQQVGML